MSMRLEMLQVARLAPKLLGESTDLIRAFLLREQNPDGGFKDRSGRSDLYYTGFGIDSLLALEVATGGQSTLAASELAERFAQATHFLAAFAGGDGLDFVHLCCLARGWGALASRGATRSDGFKKEVLGRIESFRSGDGGYNPVRGSPSGTAYGAFLALGAYQDLKGQPADPLALARSLKFLESGDGAWANERNVNTGSTNATAAAATVLRNLSVPVNHSVGDWLLARGHPEGGFRAAPQAPMPDLLSTATALHALAGMQVSFEQVREKCLDFIDTLWTNEGAFHGHWGDDHLDCEYTFYGLLALGHLSL